MAQEHSFPFEADTDSQQPRVLTRLAGGADRGSVSLLLLVVAAALFMMVGLVVDGGGKARAIAAADDVAASAAAAAAQTVDLQAYRSQGVLRADTAAAVAAAQSFLNQSGVTGRVRVTNAGRTVEVSTTATYRMVFLGMDVAVQGHATAELVTVTNGSAL